MCVLRAYQSFILCLERFAELFIIYVLWGVTTHIIIFCLSLWINKANVFKQEDKWWVVIDE